MEWCGMVWNAYKIIYKFDIVYISMCIWMKTSKKAKKNEILNQTTTITKIINRNEWIQTKNVIFLGYGNECETIKQASEAATAVRAFWFLIFAYINIKNPLPTNKQRKNEF